MSYTELQVTTNFSFLKGASHPEELVDQAAALGYTEIGIADTNTLAGIIRAHVAAKKQGIRIVVGVHFKLMDGCPVLVYPVNLKGYAAVCELLTIGNRRTEKGQCHLYREDLFKGLNNTKIIALPPQQLDENFELDNNFTNTLNEYKQHFGSNLYVAVHRRYLGNDAKYLARLAQLSKSLQVPLVAVNDVFYHSPDRRQLQDVLTCIREKCTIHTAGLLLHSNAERYLKTDSEMQRLFTHYPEAILHTKDIVNACQFSLDELKYEYPEEITTDGTPPQDELVRLAWLGANEFYQNDIPQKIVTAINHELGFIAEMNYAPYFLTVYDIVRYARSKNILCQGRGSAANSAVCFCLGITSVNPAKFDLLFERFLSAARNEPPDIDVDFEHERREEVIQYIYQKYGRHRAAIVATVTQQHEKGAIRDVAKAMGLSVDMIDKISKSILRSSQHLLDLEKLVALGININDRHFQKVISLTNQYIGFPRQLGQHTGGFVISRNPLSNLCPVLNARMENRTCLEWNKDDIEALGFLKIDVLALGMLTCIRKAFDLAKQVYGLDLTLANIPQDDPKVYDMICEADTIGVFQIESRAQQSMLPRLKPRCFYDLVIEVAIVRPGPIQGDMVHPYLRRRNGEEEVVYPSKDLEAILGRTLGVPLFQEQAMKVAIVAAGFSPTEADELRRSMATFKVKGMVTHFQQKLVEGMTSRGYSLEYAQRVFKQLEGFGSYGFPESHAASFAQLVYVSSWLKCHYPDVFACALLNSLPMGFYQPAQIVIDAKNHGVEVRPVDVNHSVWDNTMEEKVGVYFSIRLGFRHIGGMKKEDAEVLLNARTEAFTNINELSQAGLSDAALEKLADADAFRSLGLDRRQALWMVSVKDKPIAMYAGQSLHDKEESSITLPFMEMAEQVMHDYAATSLSLKAHPLSFLREKLQLLHVVTADHLPKANNGEVVKVAGLILVRQRPQTAKGIWFITLEDETGTTNLVVFPQVFEQFKKEIVQARVLMVEGNLQVEGKVIHVIVKSCHDITKMHTSLVHPATGANSYPAFPRADEVVHGLHLPFKKKSIKDALPGGRNFK